MAKNSTTLPRGIDLRSDGYRVRLMRHGKKLTETFGTLAEAVKWKEIMAGKLSGDSYEDRSEEKKLTLGQMLDKYLAEVTPTKRGYRAEANRIKAWKRESWAEWSVMAVTSRQIAQWRDARLAEVPAPAPTTISNAMNLLSHVYKIAKAEWHYKIENPCAGVVRPKQRAPRDAPPDDALEAMMLVKAKAGRAAWLASFITIAAWSAMRQGEVRQLRWEFVNFTTKLISLPASVTKTKQARGVVMLPIVEACLKGLAELAGQTDLENLKKGPVFRSLIADAVDPTEAAKLAAAGLETDALMSDNTVTSAFRRLIAQVFDDMDEHQRVQHQKITFHDLRHWGCTRLAPFHRDAVDLSKTTGHKSVQQLARYYNERPEDRAARVLQMAA
jgi:integrase